MHEPVFFICKHCGNLIGMIHDSGIPVVCCGEPMTRIVPGSVDASKEKHLPVANRRGNVIDVEIGSTAHPMTQEHLIQWVYLHTAEGGQRKSLKAGEAPKLSFSLENDTPIAVYAYCNLHGLWKTEI